MSNNQNQEKLQPQEDLQQKEKKKNIFLRFCSSVRKFFVSELSPALKVGLLAIFLLSVTFSLISLTTMIYPYGFGVMFIALGVAIGALSVIFLLLTLFLGVCVGK